MIDVDKIIRASIKKGASDIHLVSGQHPIFRVSKALINYEEVPELKEEDMFEISDFNWMVSSCSHPKTYVALLFCH